jgi:single-strand DNA-binding protein
MQSVLNLSLIEGRLTRDPELLYTKNGNALCKFDLAVNHTFKSGEKLIEEVSYIAVDTWNKVAESCAKYLKKGNLIRVKGRLKQSSWQDKQGQKRNKISIEAAGIDFLSSPKKEKQKEQVPF